MNDQLRDAAQHILEHMDGIPFVETPLHIAASAGHLQFATEIIRLKPSFGLKLNLQGFSPIHLALQQGHEKMVLRFVNINKDLVRVKGREGETPLHFVSRTGDVDLLAYFLLACPDSIEDVTVRNETALHIAVKHQKYEALQVLVGWLKRNRRRGASLLHESILNWKDEAGNNVLHISALVNDSQALQFLINSKMNLNAKNLADSTALDIANNAEITSILVRAGAKHGPSVIDAPSFAERLRTKITVVDKIYVSIDRIRGNLSEEERNAYLVVAALVATATYQTALSPAGGVYQADVGTNNLTTTSSLNFTATATQGSAGKSVMSADCFYSISGFNTLSLLLSTVTLLFLTPSGIVSVQLFGPTSFFAYSYLLSMLMISPTPGTRRFFYIILGVFSILYFGAYFAAFMYRAMRLRFRGHPYQHEFLRWRANRY